MVRAFTQGMGDFPLLMGNITHASFLPGEAIKYSLGRTAALEAVLLSPDYIHFRWVRVWASMTQCRAGGNLIAFGLL